MAYYPGPAGDSDSDSDSDGEDSGGSGSGSRGGSRKIVLAVALALAVVLIIVILYYMFSPRALSRSLARCGWTVYLRKGCGYCHKQMKLLSGFDMFVLYGPDGSILDGYTQSPPVAFSAVKGFPCWYNLRTGESRMGLQDIASLQRMAQW